MKLRRLGNKGSTWVWGVTIIVLGLLSMTWVAFDYFFNNVAASTFAVEIASYPVQWSTFKMIFNGMILCMTLGCIWWAWAATATPRSGYD